jgi:hypothetical protein
MRSASIGALARGVERGWLDRSSGVVVDRAWHARSGELGAGIQATFQPSLRNEFINFTDRSMSSVGSSTSSIDSVPSGRVMTTR